MVIRNPLIDCEVLSCARVLIELGARTSLVCEITGLSDTKARAMYRACYKRKPVSGQRKKISTYLSSTEAKLHTFVVCNAFHFVKAQAKLNAYETLLVTYRRYVEACDSADTDPLYDVNCVHRISALLRTNDIQMGNCSRCQNTYPIFLSGEGSGNTPLGRKLCPACEEYSHDYCNCGERRWNVGEHKKDCPECTADRKKGRRLLSRGHRVDGDYIYG